MNKLGYFDEVALLSFATEIRAGGCSGSRPAKRVAGSSPARSALPLDGLPAILRHDLRRWAGLGSLPAHSLLPTRPSWTSPSGPSSRPSPARRRTRGGPAEEFDAVVGSILRSLFGFDDLDAVVGAGGGRALPRRHIASLPLLPALPRLHLLVFRLLLLPSLPVLLLRLNLLLLLHPRPPSLSLHLRVLLPEISPHNRILNLAIQPRQLLPVSCRRNLRS